MSEELEMPEYYTVSELSELLPYSPQALTRKLRDGELPGEKIGRKWLIPKEEMDKILRRPKATRVKEDSAIASRSHWPKLFDAANALMSQVEAGAPFAQILGFPWRTYLDHSDGLVLTNPGRANQTLSLEIERDPLFVALKQHLPANPIWADLEAWKLRIKKIAFLLQELDETTKIRAEFNERQWPTDEENQSGSPGITEYFSKTAILEAAERKCGLYQSTHEYQQKRSLIKKGYVLELLRNSSSFVGLAAVRNEIDIESWKSKHLELCQSLLHAPEMEEICRANSDALEMKGNITEKLGRISNLVTLPGICDLYSTD